MRKAAVPVALALAGAAVAVFAGGSTAGTAIAVMLIGSAAVLAVSLVFYAVGRSEDREREAERLRRRSSGPNGAP
jgi:ABC-type transport system involved in cytochrome bd biosynthesis fused ATPase/permease subunit